MEFLLPSGCGEKWKAKSAFMGGAVTQALVDYAQPLPGMKVLDLASGTGEPAISLAERVGPQGAVAAVDQSAELLEIASRARQQQETRQSYDATSRMCTICPFADRNFDLATCRFGVMFFADAPGAMTELRRVLKVGSRAGFVAWGPMEQPYWQCDYEDCAAARGRMNARTGRRRSISIFGSGFPFRGTPIRRLSEVEESTRNFPWTWLGDSEEVFDYACAVAAPFRPMLERVPEEMWPAIRAEARSAIERYRVGDEIRFGADVVLASGRA